MINKYTRMNEFLPAINLLDLQRKKRDLKEWRGGWVVLVFLRHLGWLPCQGHLVQLHQKRKKFDETKTHILVISFESIESTGRYLKDISLDWPILIDEQKTLYRYFGMGEAQFWDIWGVQTWRAYLKEMLRGRFPRKGDGDIQQQGGNVVLDPDGRVRLQHIGSGPSDRPDVNSLLRFVREADQEFQKKTPEV